MRISLLTRYAGYVALVAGLLLGDCFISNSSARAGGLRYIYPRLFGPVVPPYGYGRYGVGYRGYGHRPYRHRYFQDRGLGIRTPPHVNRFVFRAPIAVAPYTYYYGNGFVPYGGYYGGYYSGYNGGFLGNPYYSYNSYYNGNNWWWQNGGFYGRDLPQQTYSTPAAIALENKRLQEQVDKNRKEWIEKIPGMPDRVIIAVRPSTAEDNLKSVRAQALGDRSMQRGDYANAYKYYERAVKTSSDKAEFRISLATVLAATGRFEPAVQQIETAGQLNSDLTEVPRSLDQIFLEEGASEREELMSKLFEWTREDQQDNDRLLLLGAFLVLDGKLRNAQPFLEIVAATADDDKPALAFLAPVRREVGEETAAVESEPTVVGEEAFLPPPGYGVLDISPEEENWMNPPEPEPISPSGSPKSPPDSIVDGPTFPE